MLNQSRRAEIQTVLARQIGHLTRSGESYDAAFQKLHDAGNGELKTEVEDLRRYLEADEAIAHPERRFASPVATLGRLAGIARRRHADPADILSHAEEVLGPLGESHRVYWSGIGAFLWYALVLIVMVLVVLVVFSIFVFPQLEALFEGNENVMPSLTVFTITTLSSLMDFFFFLIAAGIVALAIAAYKIREAMKRLEPLRGMMTRVPGLASLCESYNMALFLNLSRLLTFAGITAEDALNEVSHMHRPSKTKLFEEISAGTVRLDELLRTDLIAGALILARHAGTLEAELEHLSAQSQSIFGDQLAKVREEFTLIAQVIVGVVIATLVVSMYLPIFKMGTIF